MDPQLFQTIATLFGVLLTVIGFGIAWWLRNLQATLSAQQQQMVTLMGQISALNVELAKNYAPRAELQETFNRIFSLLEDIRKEVRHPT